MPSTPPSRNRRGLPTTPKMAEELAHRIEEEIIDLGWPVGALFGSETDLIARYGVSRAVFREAVRLVEHHGVAVMRRGAKGGLIVTAPDVRAVQRPAMLYLDWAGVDARQIIGARTMLEYEAIAAAVARLDDEGIAMLRETLEAERRAVGSAEDRDQLHDLHVVIADLSGNAAIRLFVETLANLTMARTRHIPYTPAIVEAMQSEHAAIVEAMIDGDVPLAQRLMGEHLDVATTVFTGGVED